MTRDSSSGFLPWSAALHERGFAFAPGDAVRRALIEQGSLADWDAFAASWDDLVVDGYMADHGRYRRRRHATFRIDAQGAASALPHRPHYQTLDYNPLHGGIERWFSPLAPVAAQSASLATILAAAHGLFGAASPAVVAWFVEVHQFRIEPTPDAAGLPTPEGVHRDGVDWVLVLMVRRRNIAAGTTTIHALDRREIGSFTLAAPFDAALVDDRRCYHGVTAVHPDDASQPAHRDVLVVTFRASDAG
jgi:hypothetical protein